MRLCKTECIWSSSLDLCLNFLKLSLFFNVNQANILKLILCISKNTLSFTLYLYNGAKAVVMMLKILTE